MSNTLKNLTNVRYRRNFGRAFFVGIAMIAFYNSYWHLVAVCIWAGQDSASAHMTPILIDAMMLLASYTIFNNQTLKNRPKVTWGRVTQMFGLVATIAGNAADAYIHQAQSPLVAALIVAAWPAVALFLSTETALSETRRHAARTSAPVKKVAPATAKKTTRTKATATKRVPAHRKAAAPVLTPAVVATGWPA